MLDAINKSTGNVETAVEVLRSDEDINRVKNQLKTSILLDNESRVDIVWNIGTRAALAQSVSSAKPCSYSRISYYQWCSKFP